MNRKEQILTTSFKLFVNHGYHNTSIQQLIEASEMSKGAFYHYFKSKNDLYNQIIEQYFLSFYRAVDWQNYEPLELTISNIETEIQQFYLNFVPKILALTEKGFSEYFIMYFEAFHIHSEFKKEIQEFYKNLEKLLINAVDNKIEPKKLATKIIAKYEGILFLLAVDSNQNIKDLLNRIKS
ncbi:MAG: TetR/AcrR family transcriptional regulator [Putridiphycobacter sp.]